MKNNFREEDFDNNKQNYKKHCPKHCKMGPLKKDKYKNNWNFED